MKKYTFLFLIIMLVGGALKAQYPLVSIDSIQRVSLQALATGNDMSPLNGDTVQVEGVVTFNPCLYGLTPVDRIGSWIQDPNENRWAGLHILIESGLLNGYTGTMADLNNATQWYDNVVPGSKIRVTGIVDQFSNNTQLLLLPITIQTLSLGNNITSQTLPIDTFMVNDGSGGQIQNLVSGEPYEGMLVQFDSVFVVGVQQSGQRWYWSIQDLQGNAIAVRDVSGHFRNDDRDDDCPVFNSGTTGTPATFTPPTLGSYIQYLRGIIIEYNGEYYVAPRTLSDVGPVIAAKPVITDVKRNIIVPSSSDAVTVSAKIIDPDGSIAIAELYYSIGINNTNFTQLNMTNTSGDIYSATIPATGTNNTYVNYWIHAIDNSGDSTSFPIYNATSLTYKTLDNGINEIADIQQTPKASGASLWAGDSISNMNIHAVVTSVIKSHDLGIVAIQDGTGPWSGILLNKTPGDNLQLLNRGDSILITSARVNEYFGRTELSSVSYILLGTGTVPQPVTGLNPDSIRSGVTSQAEAYEGMFIRFDNVAVIDTNADYSNNNNYGEWTFNFSASAPTGLRADDESNDIEQNFGTDSLAPGMQLPYIQGILDYSFSNFKLLPRNRSDIGGFSTMYSPEITEFLLQNLGVNCAVDQSALTILCTVPAGTNVTALQPTVVYSGESLSPNNATTQDFTNPVDYTVTGPDATTKTYTVAVDAGIGIDEKAAGFMRIYPNPAQNALTLQLYVETADNVSIAVYDILGNKIKAEKANLSSGSNQLMLDMSNIANGMYILEVKGENLQFSSRVNVIK